MKKTLIYVTFILGGIAVSCQSKNSESVAIAANSTEGISIAMIDTDSIFAHYDMVADMMKELETLEKKLTDDLQRQAKGFQNEYEKLQKDYENYLKIGATLTLSEQRKTEEQLKKREEQLPARQNQLQQLEQKYMQQLMEVRTQKNKEVEDKIFLFIENYNKENGNYSIIMSKARSSGTLYALPSMDITVPVLESMNAEYKTIRK